MSKQSIRRQATMQRVINNAAESPQDELFAEKVMKVSFRDYHNNTRMDIKNVDLKA